MILRALGEDTAGPQGGECQEGRYTWKQDGRERLAVKQRPDEDKSQAVEEFHTRWNKLPTSYC